jgi:hypothetical protein
VRLHSKNYISPINSCAAGPRPGLLKKSSRHWKSLIFVKSDLKMRFFHLS